MIEMIFSGFGGQGVLTTGLIMADISLADGMYPTWIPSYGAEMRGGKAYCVVKMDKVRVGTPVVEEADLVLAMNIPSLTFEEKLKKGGILLVNTDIVPEYASYVTRSDIRIVEAPLDSMARQVNHSKGANVVAAGLVTCLLGCFEKAAAVKAMLAFFEEKGKERFAKKNQAAFELGYNYGQSIWAGGD